MVRELDEALPLEMLSQEVQFASVNSAWKEIERRLRKGAPNEACVFVLARPSRGVTRTTLILREAIWPRPGEVRATPHSLEISSDYISRVMDAAIDAGELTGVVLLHTHPDTEFGRGAAFFSSRDDWYERRLFPTIALNRPKAISGSIVLGSAESDIAARIWWNAGDGIRTQFAGLIRLVGPEITFIETEHSHWKDHPEPDMMDRSTRLWGAEGRRLLQNIRVGVVGAGGTGSIALLSVATMGVGKIRVWDKDVIKKENLHRTIGAASRMIGENKAEALAAVATAAATAHPFEIDAIPEWGTSDQGLQRLKDCDLIFCCVDKFAPRVPLNDLAYAHLIPTIDMASWIHSSQGTVDAIMTHAHVWSSGIPCAWCSQTLTPINLMREAQGNQRNAENRIPYGLPLDEIDGTEPSVLALNMAGVGLALMEFMQVALKITDRTPRNLKLFLPEWEMDESDLDTVPDCGTEADIALGDAAKINPV